MKKIEISKDDFLSRKTLCGYVIMSSVKKGKKLTYSC